MRTALIATLALFAAPIHCQTAQSPALSSRDEYQKCLQDGDRLEEDRVRLEVGRVRLETAQKDLQSLIKLHAANKSRIVFRDDSAIASFNRRARELTGFSERLNDKATAMYAELNKFNARVAEANQRCAGMMISIEDQQSTLWERVKKAAEQ